MTSSAANDYYYSPKYEDDIYEYRHVHVTKEVVSMVPRNRLMSESEWRSLGVQQSKGWEHYMIWTPERHVLLFRRPKPTPSPPVPVKRIKSNINISQQQQKVTKKMK